jgi:hypothetical protein
MSAIGTGGFLLYKFIAEQTAARIERDDRLRTEFTARFLEARKPFLDRQLTLYFETAGITGQLATLEKDIQKWKDADQRYQELYWSLLSTVENTEVQTAMVNFATALDGYRTVRTLKSEVQLRALCLAHAIRDSIRSTWTVQLATGDIPQSALDKMRRDNPADAPNSANCASEVRSK